MRSLRLAATLVTASAVVSWAQARPPLPLAADTSGVLSAIRSVDLRQLCRCPTVMLDSMVRRGPRITMYDIVDQPVGFALGAADRSRLALARHQVRGTALRSMTRGARDTVFMAVQLVAVGAERKVVVSVTPPNRLTAAYLVTLRPHRGAWQIVNTHAVYDP